MTKKTPDMIVDVGTIEVASWSPGDKGEGVPCTQVHLIWTIPSFGEATFMTRYKSRAAVDALIEALIEHRDYVWPDEGDKR